MLDFSVTFVITILNIVFLFFILRAILFKPVTKFMDERAGRIQDSLERSEADMVKAKELLAQYEAQLAKAAAEAQAIINKAREQAGIEAEKIIAQGRLSAEAVLASSRKEFEDEKKAAMAHFRKEAAALVVLATSHLLEREIKTEDSRSYAQMLVEKASGV
ncbi:MAG: ATP synthase F0 subunit B [Treponema sp.]|nr:ATP synthase F0 subunit B [Treponema sp.]